ncbi:YebC/PmpR family DNA-binding transcriptional regulator [Candidatus Uhrbacteria bacterium]|nr:YebC/PmpR family DNA-binding transcriptional regulator [Candidatus Uhrbacteria bacterium]
MSRHSHWAKIKRAKGAEDAKRGVVFTKLSRVITVAAKEKGTDPTTNFKLRLAMDEARAVNMPKDTILRAIARASGGEDGAELAEVTYEAIGPGGIAFMIDALTDNRNRTGGSLKTILSKHGASLAGVGAVRWQFNRKGMVRIPAEGLPADGEAFELACIDHGAEEIEKETEGWTVILSPEGLPAMLDHLTKQNITVAFSGLRWIPKTTVTITDPSVAEMLQRLGEALEEDDDVVEVATNQE